jgi:hypothetical protein
MMYPLWHSRSEAEVERGGDFSEAEAEAEAWGRARQRPSPELPVAPEAELGGGRDLLSLVLPWWLAQ